jgi:hypothetical protein
MAQKSFSPQWSFLSVRYLIPAKRKESRLVVENSRLWQGIQPWIDVSAENSLKSFHEVFKKSQKPQQRLQLAHLSRRLFFAFFGFGVKSSGPGRAAGSLNFLNILESSSGHCRCRHLGIHRETDRASFLRLLNSEFRVEGAEPLN